MTGVTRRTWIVEVIMPPTMGAAIGRMTSEPVPVDQKIGTSESVAAATVISFGRRRRTEPSRVASRMSSRVTGAACESLVESLVEVDDHDDTRLDRDAVERDVADPDRDGEVVAEQPLKNDPPGHRVDDGEHHD